MILIRHGDFSTGSVAGLVQHLVALFFLSRVRLFLNNLGPCDLMARAV